MFNTLQSTGGRGSCLSATGKHLHAHMLTDGQEDMESGQRTRIVPKACSSIGCKAECTLQQAGRHVSECKCACALRRC